MFRPGQKPSHLSAEAPGEGVCLGIVTVADEHNGDNADNRSRTRWGRPLLYQSGGERRSTPCLCRLVPCNLVCPLGKVTVSQKFSARPVERNPDLLPIKTRLLLGAVLERYNGSGSGGSC